MPNRLSAVTLAVSLLLSPVPLSSQAEAGSGMSVSSSDLIEVEAAPEDNSIELEGPRHQIEYVDESTEDKADYIALFSHVYSESITVPLYYVAVQVSHQMEVLHVVNPSVGGMPPTWEPAPVELEIPEGGFVLLAHDDSYATKGYKKFLAENFRIGDTIKLRKNGEIISLENLIANGPKPSIQLDQDSMLTVTEETVDISGTVSHSTSEDVLTVGESEVVLNAADGRFETSLQLDEGVNYIDIVLRRDGEDITKTSMAIYYKQNEQTEADEVLLWIEQGPNAHKFQSGEDIRLMLEKAKDTGITGVILDVKGYEGFASYQQSDMTNRPYVSEMSGPNRGGANPDLDLLAEFVKYGHELGLTVHAAVNVFAEGSMFENAVLDDHPEWEERVYRPEDQGAIVPIRQSQAQNKVVAFVNPAHEQVRQYQLDTFEEILKNYDVDGINLDRGRYDNYFADFSETSKVQFAAYLAERGKELEKWPDDVYRLEYDANGQAKRIEGQHYLEWWAYRAEVIKSFTDELRLIVDRYSEIKGKKIQMSSYVGSWYESMYVHGINWASPDFRYDERLGFTEDRIYTEDYYTTGYLRNLDFLMIGTYQSTAREIQRYMTLGNILTQNEIPLYASIALSNVQDPSLQREVFQAVQEQTDGMMLFDYSLIHFDMIKAALRNEVYVKPYQLGISVPGNPEQFIEGTYLNVNRNEGDLNVYTRSFGPSTGTSRWGVEIAVDENGTVIETANREQAKEWDWGTVEDNDLPIPDGGFVISAADEPGDRDNRQKVANHFALGDEVRAALLSGHLDDDGITVNHHQYELEGTVEVIGYGQQLKVLINGKKAKLNGNRANENGQKLPVGEPIVFKDKIKLADGDNSVTITVYVDGRKTNEYTLHIRLAQ